jgi:hypothetical protein
MVQCRGAATTRHLIVRFLFPLTSRTSPPVATSLEPAIVRLTLSLGMNMSTPLSTFTRLLLMTIVYTFVTDILSFRLTVLQCDAAGLSNMPSYPSGSVE